LSFVLVPQEYLIRQAIPVFWWEKAKRRILAALMQMGDDVHVLDDVTTMHRDIREHFPFLVIGRLEWLFLLPKVVLIRLFIRMQTKQYTRSMLKKSQK